MLLCFVGLDRYLGAVQQFVALQLYSGGDSSSVLNAVQFIRILYVANQNAPKVRCNLDSPITAPPQS